MTKTKELEKRIIYYKERYFVLREMYKGMLALLSPPNAFVRLGTGEKVEYLPDEGLFVLSELIEGHKYVEKMTLQELMRKVNDE